MLTQTVRTKPINFSQKTQSDPIDYLERAFGSTFWLKQVEIIASVRDNPKTSVASCHASGKTYTAGHIALWFLAAYKNSIVITTAPTARQVEDMLWKEIRSAHERAKAKLPGKMLHVRYNIGPEWYAVGLSTNKPDKFQGYHAEHILIIVDESSGIPPEIWEAVEGVGSTGDVRIVELGNPTDPTGHFSQTFTSPFYTKFHISCFDTPNFDPFRVLDKAGRIDEPASIEKLRNSTLDERRAATTNLFLIAPEWVYQRLIEWGSESPMFQARCLGRFPKEGDNTLIPLHFVEQSQNRWEDEERLLKPYEGRERVLGVDVARFGSDKTVYVAREGDRILGIQRFSKESTTMTAGRIVDFLKANPWYSVNVDDSGVGGGVTDMVQEALGEAKFEYNGYGCRGINVGEGAFDTEQFINKRAEFYWALAERFKKGEISIPPDEMLAFELNSIKVFWNRNGKIFIEPKDEMRKKIKRSPDTADAVMLAFAPLGVGQLPDDDEETTLDTEIITRGLRDRVF